MKYNDIETTKGFTIIVSIENDVTIISDSFEIIEPDYTANENELNYMNELIVNK